MSPNLPPRRYLSLAIAACISGATSVPVLAQEGSMIEEIIVTSQRRAESIQDVPIAVSAFSGDDLQARRIDDARDLQTVVPNLTFTGSGTAGAEGFQIRGVGNAVGGTTGDVGVGIHHNNAPQVQSRIATAEAYDMERVEVLRGPQGTLYGRNATGGVINYITAKPQFEEFDASISGEVASYSSRKLRGMVNLPIGESMAFRLAGNWLERDGYTENVSTGNDIDDRELWSARATFAFAPTEWLDGWLLYEAFEEDDTRSSGSRSLCIHDPGPTQVGGTEVSSPLLQNFLSQGCLPGSIYEENAYSHPNSVATFGGRFALFSAVVGDEQVVPLTDLYAGQTQPSNLRETAAYRDPSLEVDHDIIEFELNFHLTDELTMSLLGHSSEDTSYATNGSFEGEIGFLDTPVTPGGVWTDFQSGAATGMRTLNIFDFNTEQESLELRLQSAYTGPLNFNIGLLALDVERDQHTWVSTNTTTLFLASLSCAGIPVEACPVYHDQNPTPDYTGHQYFDTWTPYNLESRAVFGELYYDLSDTLKVTAGLRYTDDQKQRTNLEIQLLQEDGAGGIGTGGYPAEDVREDEVDFQEWTGRLVLDWMPETSFSDSTLVYTSYSRGYKSGGFNSAEQGVDTFTPYEPEFVNAYEIGTKNSFGGGRTQLNASLFFYDYQDYQISKIEQFSARNENIDAEVWGLEVESQFELVENLQLFGNLGWLRTEVKSGQSVDPLDRTAGDPSLTFVRDFQAGCVAPTAVVEGYVQAVQGGLASPLAFFAACGGLGEEGDDAYIPPLPGVFGGVEQDLSGNELPNAPEFSAMIGLRYNWQMGGWDSNFLIDYSWKDEAYASVFNGVNYELESWENANASLNLSNYDLGIDVQLFVKNLFDDDTIVNYSTGSDGTGLPRNLTLLDPRIYGLNIGYHF